VNFLNQYEDCSIDRHENCNTKQHETECNQVNQSNHLKQVTIAIDNRHGLNENLHHEKDVIAIEYFNGTDSTSARSQSSQISFGRKMVHFTVQAIPGVHEKNIVENQQMISSLFMTPLPGLVHLGTVQAKIASAVIQTLASQGFLVAPKIIPEVQCSSEVQLTIPEPQSGNPNSVSKYFGGQRNIHFHFN